MYKDNAGSRLSGGRRAHQPMGAVGAMISAIELLDSRLTARTSCAIDIDIGTRKIQTMR